MGQLGATYEPLLERYGLRVLFAGVANFPDVEVVEIRDVLRICKSNVRLQGGDLDNLASLIDNTLDKGEKLPVFWRTQAEIPALRHRGRERE